MMADPNDEVTSYLLEYLDPDDFTDAGHRQVFTVMREMFAKKIPIDVVSVSDNGNFNIVDLGELTGDGYKFNARSYAQAIKTESYRRKAMAKTAEMQKGILRGDFTTPDEIVEYMNNSSFDALPCLARKPETMSEIIDELLDVTESEMSGKMKLLRYNFKELDQNTGGLRPAEITVIAAGPGTGKTAFMMHAVANMARKGGRSLVIMREMHRIQVAKRVIAAVAGVDAESIRDGRTMSQDAYAELARGAARVRGLPITIDSTSYTVEAVCNRAKRMREKGNLDILCVDYFQLLKSSKRFDGRRPELDHISRELKMLTLELDIPLILLSQINRESRKAGVAPELYDLRETGALEQDADNVIFLWDPTEADKTKPRDQIMMPVEVLVRKQRSGRTGKVEMMFDKAHQRFLGMERSVT